MNRPMQEPHPAAPGLSRSGFPHRWPGLLLAGLLTISRGFAAAGPAMICYSVQPNAYLNEKAAEIKKIYDGFFFTIGSWENTARRFAGTGGAAPEDKGWLEAARVNLANLRQAGVTENFLTVHFADSGEWPSAPTLLSGAYTGTMAGEFGAVGRVAKELGFRGVCVDVEYPYPRYAVSHQTYTYDNYTVGDLLAAGARQGQAVAAAMLDAFPEAVVVLLPGGLRGRPIEREFMLGMLRVMAERDAPGGFHLGTEYTYCLHDPVTALATTRFEDPAVPLLAESRVADYWKRRSTMAPGVWPLHAVETGGQDYPQQPWKQEIEELRRQMAILRSASKRYVWSFAAHPAWYHYSPDLEAKYGLQKPDLKQPDIDLRDWHRILSDKPTLGASPLAPLLDKVRQFDQERILAEELCDAFGTPGRWQVLGMLGNPHTQPQFAGAEALLAPLNPAAPYHGRDGAVRWFAWDNLDPRGVTSCVQIFDYRNTDNASAHFVTFVHCPSERGSVLHTGWDDGILVKLDDRVLFDARSYPGRGKGLLYRDKYQFEKRVPFTLPKGKSRLAVTSINSHGNWLFSLRITDENDFPFQDVRFRLE